MEYIQIGKISSIHGVKGEVKVVPLTDDIKRFDELKSVLIGIDKEKYDIFKVNYSKNQVIIKFKNIDCVKDAEKLLGKFLSINIKDAKKEKNAYFLFEIIGLEAFDTKGNKIGKISNVLQSGRNDIYVVKDGEKENLIPAIKEFVKKIDLKENKIIIDPIEGLIE